MDAGREAQVFVGLARILLRERQELNLPPGVSMQRRGTVSIKVFISFAVKNSVIKILFMTSLLTY